MSKLVNSQLAINLATRAKELIETRGWWRGIRGELRQVIDVDGKPTGMLENPKRVSGYTLAGALTTASIEAVRKIDQDKVNLSAELANLFVEAAIAKHCNEIHYTTSGFNSEESTDKKKVINVLNTAITAMKEQLK